MVTRVIARLRATFPGGGGGPVAAHVRPAHVLTLNKDGVFYNVNKVVALAYLAQQRGLDFAVRWPNSLYKDELLAIDPWRYYFEPPFAEVTRGTAAPVGVAKLFPRIGLSADNIIQPRLIEGYGDGLGLPKDRALAGEMVEQFIRPTPLVADFIDDFANNFFTRPVVGLHIRGAGRAHFGGSSHLRGLLDPDGEIPFGHYFAAVDAALADRPDALIFACSDSQDVIDRVRAHYGDRVVSYPASRSSFGEMHENHPKNEGRAFSKFKLGLDVVVEAHLLARCAHFVHGNSNVANFILCRAPAMASTYVYAPVEAQYVESLKADMARAAATPALRS